MRGNHITSLVLDLREVSSPGDWALSNGLKAGMTREDVVALMGLPGGGEFASANRRKGMEMSFRLAYIYPDHGLRVLFNDRWKVSQIMLVATQNESERLDGYLAEIKAKLEAQEAELGGLCTHINDLFGAPASAHSNCVDWLQDEVVYDFSADDMDQFGTCVGAIETEDEDEAYKSLMSCICAVNPDNWGCLVE